MGQLAQCLPVTLKYEGLWSDNPHDPGGATMKGVTQKVYDAYRKRHGWPLRSVRYIADDELLEIYDLEYFRPIGGKDLEAGVDLVSFDYAVNSGVKRAKTALNYSDGLAGVSRVKDICNRRLSFLHGLKTWSYFGKGWGRRVADVMAKGIVMASKTPMQAKANLQIAAAEQSAAGQKKGKAALASISGSAGSTVAAQVQSTDISFWSVLGVAGLLIGVAVLLYVLVRKHEDVADVLIAASERVGEENL